MLARLTDTLLLGGLPYRGCLVLSQAKLHPSLFRQLGAIVVGGLAAIVPLAIGAPYAAKMGIGNLIVMAFATCLLLVGHVATLLWFRQRDARASGTERRAEARFLKALFAVAGLVVVCTVLFVFDQNRPR
jgi:hypothetical protein